MTDDSTSPRYRRRNRWPVAVVVVVLLVGAIVVWTQILKPAPAAASGCNAPTARTATARTTGPAPSTTGTRPASSAGSATAASTSTAATTLGSFTDPSTLSGVRPADPSTIPIRVYNASDVIGQAKTVTDELRSAGFSSVLQQQNDPLYPNFDLQCYGEIRYGYAGLAEARTALIVAPCAQLVLDGRSDNTIDLSLGKLYQVEAISSAVRKSLKAIADASAPPPVVEGRTISVRSQPPIPPLPSRSACPA